MGDLDNMLAKGDEKKLFKLNFDTYLFAKQIREFQKYTNVIDLNLSTSLLDLINSVQDFLTTARTKQTNKTSLEEIKSNFDSKIANVRRTYVCSVCNSVVISGRENLIKHFKDQFHIKNVNIANKTTVSSKTLSISSTNNKPPSVISMQSNASTSKPQTPALIQKLARKAEKLERQRLLALDPYRENLTKRTINTLNKPFKQIEKLTLGLIEEGQAQAKHITTYEAVCTHIQKALEVSYPNNKCYVFGSRATGLSTARGDIDIFVNIGNYFHNRPSKGVIFDAIQTSERLLKKTKLFSHFQKVLAARTPILRTFCVAEKIDCDLSFSNGLSFCNTELITYFLNLQPVCRKLVTFLKHWFGPLMNNFGVSNYLVTLLAVFYLQKMNLLPSVALLQTNVKPVLIQGWKSNFARPSLEELNLEPNDDFAKHLIGFFHYYGFQFSFETHMVCPLLGYELEKKMFDPQNIVTLPEVFAPFKNYIADLDMRTADEVDDLFANHKPLVVQDPFDLIHNVGKGMALSKVNRFIAFCRKSCELLHANMK